MGNTQKGNTQNKTYVGNNSTKWLNFAISETDSMVIIYKIDPNIGYVYPPSKNRKSGKSQQVHETDSIYSAVKIVPTINIPQNQSPNYKIVPAINSSQNEPPNFNNKYLDDIDQTHQTDHASSITDIPPGTLPVRKNPVTDTTDPKVNIFNRIGKCMGLANPFNSCFLNSVLQVIRGCVDFAKDFMSLRIEEKFKISFTFQSLLKSLKAESDSINEHLSKLQRYFEAYNLNGDDVHTVYLNLLSAIHKELKKTNNPTDGSNSTYYEKQKLKNDSIIFEYFYGVMQYITKCKTCKKEIYTSNQLIKSCPIYVPKSNNKIELQNCVNDNFKPMSVDLEEKPECNCGTKTPEIQSSSIMTYAPKYLLIYLNRGSYYEHGSKNDTFITNNGNIIIKIYNEKLKKLSKVSYNLISVIDHMGSSDGGHYFCKCSYETDRWWLLSDTQVDVIDASISVSKDTNTFIFKRDS